MGSFSERRQTIRIAVHGNLNVESVSAGQSLTLVDVGMGGFCIRTRAALPLDLVASYRFVTPDRRWSAIFRARAVHCKPEMENGKPTRNYLNGLTFVNVESPALQRQLLAMMDHAMTFVSFS